MLAKSKIIIFKISLFIFFLSNCAHSSEDIKDIEKKIYNLKKELALKKEKKKLEEIEKKKKLNRKIAEERATNKETYHLRKKLKFFLFLSTSVLMKGESKFSNVKTSNNQNSLGNQRS